jgi:hypothetical protein
MAERQSFAGQTERLLASRDVLAEREAEADLARRHRDRVIREAAALGMGIRAIARVVDLTHTSVERIVAKNLGNPPG